MISELQIPRYVLQSSYHDLLNFANKISLFSIFSLAVFFSSFFLPCPPGCRLFLFVSVCTLHHTPLFSHDTGCPGAVSFFCCDHVGHESDHKGKKSYDDQRTGEDQRLDMPTGPPSRYKKQKSKPCHQSCHDRRHSKISKCF